MNILACQINLCECTSLPQKLRDVQACQAQLKTNFCIPASEQKLAVWVAASQVFQSKKANLKYAILLLEQAFSSILRLKENVHVPRDLFWSWKLSEVLQALFQQNIAILIIARIVILLWIQN